MSQALFEKHQQTLNNALTAIQSREFFSAYPEVPSGKIYGADAKAEGQAAFEARLNKPFKLLYPHADGTVGAERSPYGFDLGIQYPAVNIDEAIESMQAQIPEWRDAGKEVRTGICLEILERLNKASFELGFACMHTSGQGFVMAFQAGGPHAQDRGLEAIAYAYQAMDNVAEKTHWVKPQGKHDPISVEKQFRIVPKGISLAIACATFPTWNSYGGIFASLITGNPVLVKPHPNSILPLAITVEIAQQVLVENGFAPQLVTMVADEATAPVADKLAQREEVKIIDFTGSTAFGDWLEQNAHQARVYTEKAGVNSIIIDSVEAIKPVVQNLSFSLCLYSGQMCTTPQNIYIPEGGIETADGKLSFEEVSDALCTSINKFLSDPARAAEVLGAIQSDATMARMEEAAEQGEVLLASEMHKNPTFENAPVLSPVVLKVDPARKDIYMKEQFGPIVYVIPTANTTESIALAKESAKTKGAITWGVYSTSNSVLDAAESAALDVAVPLSCNMTMGLFVNQSAAFSDYHCTGANPAANASLTNGDFVAGRFAVTQSRRHV